MNCGKLGGWDEELDLRIYYNTIMSMFMTIYDYIILFRQLCTVNVMKSG